MPFTVRPRRRFPVYCPVTYQTGLFEGYGTMWNLSLAGWRFFLTLLVGCASVPSLPSQASFTQHILDPLSSQIANQKIDQRKAKIVSGRLDPGLMSTLGSIVAPTLGYPPAAGAEMGSLMAGYLNSSIEQQLTIVESRRSALKEELFALYLQRTKRIENGFAVCVEGQERHYVMEEGSFTRSLTDGPGPCEQSPLQSLQFP